MSAVSDLRRPCGSRVNITDHFQQRCAELHGVSFAGGGSQERSIGGRSRDTEGPGLDPAEALSFQRGASHLCSLGPRAISEFLMEIGKQTGRANDILELLAQFKHRLDPGTLRRVGGDRFPPRRPLELPR